MNDLGIIEQFRAAMAAQGLVTNDPIEGDGKIHRFHVEGDRKGSKTGWYCLHIDDKPAGNFGCNKRYGLDQRFSWTAKREARPLTQEERREFREKMERQRAEKLAAERARHAEAAARAQAIWDAAAPATDDHPYLERKGVKAHGLRVGRWEIVNEETGEVRLISDNALLVPIMDRTRKLHSLQAIFPGKLLGAGTRDKDYLKFGAKEGFFHAIGKPLEHDGRRVFVIVEGYATGASIHECTGHAVLVTFDTSNLIHVARAIRERQPDAIILFAADNDQWTEQPVKNPGVHYARRAAEAVDGLVAVPQFADLDGKPTDFNDLHSREGAAAVVAAIEAALNPKLEPEPPLPDDDEDMPWEDVPLDAYVEDAGQPDPAPAAPAEPAAPASAYKAPPADSSHDDDPLQKNGYFTILGYDGGKYYFFSHEKRQVMELSKGDFSDIGLIELAPTNWWEEHFPGEKSPVNRRWACDWIFRTANARGIYDPSRVRGRGAWIDNGRQVYHHGGHLTVNGVRTDITALQSGYVYPMSRRLPDPSPNPLTDEEGTHLVRVAEMARWSMPGSAALFAGFAMLAPICGALTWRPHIWITGGPGTGKSTLQKQFLGALLRDMSVYAQGNSTEAGIRQELRGDALPVLIDEAESNNERDKARIENIISLIRQTSTESQAKTLKGTVSGDGQQYHIRSMFCLASINVNMPTRADIDRLTKLTIRPAGTGGADHWKALEAELTRIDEDPEISSRLLARALSLMPVILESVKVFRRVAAKHFGTQRDGDQFGTLLAGCWCLQKSTVPTEAEAAVLIKGYDWKEHVEDHDQDDAMRALEAILGAKLRVGSGGEFTVFELVREASPTHRHNTVDATVADATLKRHGIRAEFGEGELWFGTSVTNLTRLVKDMPFVTDLRGQLLRIKGAKRIDKAKKFNGADSKVVAVPLSSILVDEDGGDDAPI